MTLLDSASAPGSLDRPRTYEVRTFGCQMNVHDSERLSGSLEAAGYVRASDGDADVVVGTQSVKQLPSLIARAA